MRQLCASSVAGQLINVTLTGQTSQNSNFTVLVDPTGSDFTSSDLITVFSAANFGNGFNSRTAFFTDPITTSTEALRIINGGRPGELQISGVSFTVVPGPIAGAGLPALLALGGFVWARRRKSSSGPALAA